MPPQKHDPKRPWEIVAGELRPFPGRVQTALRSTLSVVLALLLAETLRISGIALAVALLFLMQRERPALTLRIAFEMLLGAAASSIAALLWVQFTDGTAEGRFLGIVLGIFLSAFCMNTARWPIFWTIFGFFGFVTLAAWDTHQTQDAIVTTTLYNLAALTIVVLCATLVEYAFASRHPRRDLEEELKKRLHAAGVLYAALADGDAAGIHSARRMLLTYAHAGSFQIEELHGLIEQLDSSPQDTDVHISTRIELVTHIVEQSALYATHAPESNDSATTMYRELSDKCFEAETKDTDATPISDSDAWPSGLRNVATELKAYISKVPDNDPATPPAEPAKLKIGPASFFAPEAFTSSRPVYFALKLTLAVTVCYILYNAVAWPGIITCVVTVLFTGLNSTGAMKQKQLFRFVGAAIGGCVGVATVSLIFPSTDSITALVVIVAIVAFVSGWILQSPTMGYVGVQLGFAFLLVAISGFRASTQIVAARDRLVGIALGTLCTWIIFDQLWPVNTTRELERFLKTIRAATQRLHDKAVSENAVESYRLRRKVADDFAASQQLETAAYFDIGRNHRRELMRCRELLGEIEDAAAEFYAETVVSDKATERPAV